MGEQYLAGLQKDFNKLAADKDYAVFVQRYKIKVLDSVC